MAVDALIARLAARQNNVVTHRQLRSLGLSEAAIAHRIASGRLYRLDRGVYLVGSPAPPPLARETAALFACAPGAVLSHRTAARLQRLRDLPTAEVHLTTARDRRSRDGIRLHRTRLLPPHDIRRHERLPITAPVRTILDLAATEQPRDVERALNEAQVQRMLTLRQLERRLDTERGRRGVALLRTLVERRREPQIARIEVVQRFLELVECAGLPKPRTEYRIGRYRVDFAWPDQHLAGELDSIAFHSTQPKFVGDRRRWADLDGLGWRLFRFTWWDVVEEPEALLVRLTRSLARRSD